MKKYWEIFKVNVSIYFVYRLSFFLWRVRNIFNFIIIYFLWSSVYTSKLTIFSYSKEQMMTYVLGITIAGAIVLATRTTDVANEIVSGNIINYLLKPLPFFSFVITKEAADKAVNSISAVLEVALLIFLFHPQIFIQTHLDAYFLAFIAAVIGSGIAFFLSLTLSFIAFWTAETWAPRFVFFIFITLLAGTFFPLDILPQKLYNILLITPFPYLIYLPVKIYLTGFSFTNMKLLLIGLLWLVIFYIVAKKIWHKGIKQFSFYGK